MGLCVSVCVSMVFHVNVSVFVSTSLTKVLDCFSCAFSVCNICKLYVDVVLKL